MAREVFLERGIRATTLEVAERAGVSEGSLFHRFRTKEALFRSAMNLDREEMTRRFLETLRSMEGEGLREGLEQFATQLLEIGRVAIPLMMMNWSNPEACAEGDHKVAYRGLLLGVINHFEGQIQKGALRRVDAEVLARMFLGAIHHYCMVRAFAPEAPHVVVPESMFVRGLVDILLEGAGPRSTV